MVKARVEEESEYRYEEGWVKARLASVVEREVTFKYKAYHKAVKDGEAKVGEEGSFTQWRWNFTFGDGGKIHQDTRNRITTREDDQARRFYEAFLGRPLEIGEEIDTDVIEGLEAWIFISHDDPRDNADGTKSYYCSVTDAKALDADTSELAAAVNDEPPF